MSHDTPAARRTIVFDFGGVLFRWQPLLLIQEVLPRRAPDAQAAQRIAQDVFQSFAPGADWSEFDRGAIEVEALAPRLAQRAGLETAEVLALIDAIPPHLEPQAGTVALLRRLRDAGERLCFLSNMPRPYAAYLRAHHEFLGWFEDGVFSCDVGLVKPEAAIFEHTTRALGLAPARTLFIDDHPANLAQAREHGWQVVHFVEPQGCSDEVDRLLALRSPAVPGL